MMTPTKLLLPRPPVAPISEGQFPALLENLMQYIWEKVRECLGKVKQNQKEYYDQKLVPANLDVGDRVYNYNPTGKPSLATKLLPHWIGPYIITKITNTNTWIRPISKPFMESKSVHLNLSKKFKGTNVPPKETEHDDVIEEVVDSLPTEEQWSPDDSQNEPMDIESMTPNEEMDLQREEMEKEERNAVRDTTPN